MPILHKNITAEADIHNPKWIPSANNGDVAWKNEKGELESTDELVLPAALNFVDASVAPPTTNTGDIYILSSGGSVDAGWGVSASLQDWVRYDGTDWNEITPQKSSLCYNETDDTLYSYDGAAWGGIGGGNTIYTADDTIGSGRVATLTDTVRFEGGTFQVEGLNTLSTSTAFEIYDGDTTPNKLWDFRNDGGVYLGKSEQVFYGADAGNNQVLAFKVVGSGHNLVKVGKGGFRTLTETAFHAVGKNGQSSVLDSKLSTSDFIFEQDNGNTFTILSDNTVQLELQNSNTSGFTIVGTTNYFAFLSDFGSYPYAFHKGKGHWFSISGSEARNSNFESGVAHVFEDGDLQMWATRITATGSNFASLGGSIKFVADQRTPTNAYSNDLEIAPNTDVNGNYWLEFKNTGGSVGLKVNGNDALPMLPEFTVAGVPAADADNKGGFVCITDETGGYVTAFSDGTNWRRTTDRAIIS